MKKIVLDASVAIKWFFPETDSEKALLLQQKINDNLIDVFDKWKVPIYGAFLDGLSIHTLENPASGVILMGNESKGISPELEVKVTQKVTIPGFGKAESLNVAIATAILTDNFKRLIP
jgi:TrmH family RNA methyltransferase